MSPKELKQLADACRKAGIKHYKSGDVEFTLADTVPVSDYKRKKAATKPKESAGPIDVATDGWDDLTEEQKLFWSIGGQTLHTGDSQ